MGVKIKRVYEPAGRGDGYRVLVDRLWPRGISKPELHHHEWAKEIAPSSELRKDFGHEAGKWPEFQKKYRAELREPEARKKLSELASRARKGNLTLIYGAKDEAHNNAVVLKSVLERMLRS